MSVMLSFNPCYVGLWSVRHRDCFDFFLLRLFQSLLCWIMVCKDEEMMKLLEEKVGFNPCYVGLWSVRALIMTFVKIGICFNPCYVGLWSVRQDHTPSVDIRTRFNPCYVGLWSVRISSCVVVFIHNMFQSLLCWIMVCKIFL